MEAVSRSVSPRRHRPLGRRTAAALPLLAYVVLGLHAGAQAQAPAPTPLESGSVRALAIESTPGTESAWFRLDADAVLDPSAPDPKRPPLGVAHWSSAPNDPSDPALGRRLELEVVWFEGDVRVLFAERHLAGERRLLFRERRSTGGRTVLMSAREEGRGGEPVLLVTEIAGGAVQRTSLDPSLVGIFPLSLIDACRVGGVRADGSASGVLTLLWPTQERLVEVEARFEPSGDGERSLALAFADGGSGPSFRFRGSELVGFRWQAGGPQATRIDADEHARWLRYFAAGAH